MWRRRLSVHAHLTIAIAGAFTGAMIGIVTIALIVTGDRGIAVVPLGETVSVSQGSDAATGAPIPEDGETLRGQVGDDGVTVVFASADGTVRVETVGLARPPQLMLWAIVVLAGFAVVAVAIAATISRQSLRRLDGITMLARDISETDLGRRLHLAGPDDEIKQLGDTFDGMLDRLERVFAQQGQFVANASHELRTPLTTVRTALEIPMAQGLVPPDLEPAFRVALRANGRSERLIAALLVLARARHEDHAALGVVSLDAILGRVLDEARAEPDARHLRWHEEIVPEVTVLGDASLLDLALRNLIENAIHHNVDAGTIQVTLRRVGTDAILEIANSGTVLDGDIDRLREPFYRHAATRLGATDRAPGFGLGLSLVDSVVTLHRGELVLEARAEGGLLVTVRLPLSSDGRPCSQVPGPSGRRDGTTPLA